jgi:hypothetical protein
MKTQKIIGIGRIVDWNEESTTYRVRLCDSGGLPQGDVLTGVKLLPAGADAELTAFAKQHAEPLFNLSDDELDTMARQNLLYNSHNPVIIE